MESEEIKNVLIITASGGGGLLQSAKGQEQEVRVRYPHAKVVKRDLMLDWAWKIIGIFGVHSWNWAQKTGIVWIQEFLANWQQVAEWIFWPKVFYKMYRTLIQENIDWVIDTQVVCTGALMKAIRLYNRKYNKNVTMQRVTVDLPTVQSSHCFRGIRNLSKKDRKLIKLLTIEPLLAEGETEKDFWYKNCKLGLEDVIYEKFPIRHSFKKFIGKKRKEEPFFIKTTTKSIEESAKVASIYQRGGVLAKRNEDGFSFTIEPNDRLLVILLGSKPSFDGTLGYVKNFISVVRQLPKTTHYHLFVFCAEYKKSSSNLFQAVCRAILEAEDYPEHLSVIPMSFQNEDTIASLFYRSNLSITRAGGQTAMELMGLSKGEVWIHSEVKHAQGEVLDFYDLLKGIPAWEAGNTCYLKEKRGSKIVTPESLEPLCLSTLQEG